VMKKSWYWPVGIIIAYGGFVLLLAGSIFIANSQRNDLVTKDYYDSQIKYQEQIERIQRTTNLPGPFRLDYEAESEQLVVRFPEQFVSQNVRGSITLYRPSDANLDRSIPIALDNNGMQIIETNRLASGLWRVKINCAMDTLEYYHEEVVIF